MTTTYVKPLMKPLGFALLAAAIAFAANGPALSQSFLSDGDTLYNLPVTSMRDIPFRTVVRQQYDYSCGSAAVATLLHHHYGVGVSEAEVFKAMYAVGDQAKIRKVGFSLLDIKRYLTTQGFDSDGYRATYDQLARTNRPAIAVITVGTYRHFVVIKGVREDAVLVGDPALGLKTYSRDEFSRVWNGIIFVIQSGPEDLLAYNDTAEWQPWATAPLGQAMGNASLSGFTRDLPPIYQVSPMLGTP
ncbi:C39 family peptidase [Asticcacaulis tiandongensis]|uniref:C39 family peptidase n=1 Tax=Asticcacaulis tiandongensis TaxID=2565365 RepID=UPI00112EC75C|nr:C39 family peptidase [Asticcacaulis tiandongensis]